jgi:putative peptidoglycan lipid II flippase
VSFRRGAFKVGIGNAASKILGLGREILFAYALGTSPVADAFRFALSLVLIPTQFATGELTTASVVPVLRRTWLANVAGAYAIARRFGAGLFLFGVAVAITLFSGSKLLPVLLAPGFEVTSAQYATRFIRVLSLSAPFYTLSVAFALIGIAIGRFAFTAWSPVVRNLGLLVGLLLFLRFRAVDLMAWGFVLGYVGFCIVGVLATRGLRADGASSSAVVTDEIRGAWQNIWAQVQALFILVVVTQVGLLAERVITTFAGSGAVAAIDYARFITETPSLLIAMPVGVAALSKFAGGSWVEHREISVRLCRSILYITVPLAVGTLAAAPVLVSIVFQRGAFGTASVILVTRALTGSSLGIVTGSLAYVVQRIFSARGRNRELLWGITLSTVTGLVLALSLVSVAGVFAIALASSIGQGIYAIWGLRRLGLLNEFRRAPLLMSLISAGCVFTLLISTGLWARSNWVLLAPGLASALCMFAFSSVRRDLRWAMPGRNPLRAEAP